jgi:hypothetical protein
LVWLVATWIVRALCHISGTNPCSGRALMRSGLVRAGGSVASRSARERFAVTRVERAVLAASRVVRAARRSTI